MHTTHSPATPNVRWSGPMAGPGEMQEAERVQSRLRPRSFPRFQTLQFAGHCLPGRALGGDFYDFLEPRTGQLALILGDVSGHGLPAALLMSALQASVRTHYALSVTGLSRRIESVNRLFFECTAPEHYATLFLGEYDDGSGQLGYANCGHVAPLLLRSGGSVEWLRSTGTALGMFPAWNGSVAETTLADGDMLVLVSDGVLEAADPGDGEFGDLRLLSAVIRYRHLGPAAVARAIARELRLTCGKRPVDDATVVVARAREAACPAEEKCR